METTPQSRRNGGPAGPPAAAGQDTVPPGATARLLRADPDLACWVRELETAALPPAEVRLSAGGELAETLLDLAVPHEDVNPLVAARAALDDGLGWLLDRCVRVLVRDMGVAAADPAEEADASDEGDAPHEAAGIATGPVRRFGPALPALPAGTGPAGHWFPALVFAAALPHTLAYHRAHGVPPEVSRRTLADLGRQLALHRRRHGTGGVVNAHWLVNHFRGVLYQLGRLQFERTRLGGAMGRAVAAAGLPSGPGGPALGVHVPDFRGPLTPEACQESVDRAREFFRSHFPQEHYPVAVCHSWLLDPQLADHLPAEANIVRFARRFRPGYPEREVADRETVGFVFGDGDLPFGTLPRRSTLERAIADHLAAGGHWYGGNGWFAL